MQETWIAPSNIALIKYWGKKENQIPSNPSISFTLSKCLTQMDFSVSDSGFELFFNEEEKLSHENQFFKRMKGYLDLFREENNIKSDKYPQVYSQNTFPHSSGIASSASSFACFASVLSSFYQLDLDQKVISSLARLGSGSACRSIFGGMNLWGKSQYFEGSSNDYAIRIDDMIHPIFQGLKDSILIVDSSKESMSSSLGHELMNNHPYNKGRMEQVQNHLKLMKEILVKGEWQDFQDVVEAEAMSLHALIMSSEGGFNLLRPNTLLVIEKIKHFRNSSKTPLTFTLDAGPNIHLIYPSEVGSKIQKFINGECSELLEESKVIHDHYSNIGAMKK